MFRHISATAIQRKLGLSLTLLAGVAAACMPTGASAQLTAAQAAPTQPWTTQFDLRSQNVGDVYRITVGLPRGYNPAGSVTYPVLYVLDANGFYETVLETARLAQLRYQLPKIIVVGVGYPVEDFRRTWGLRTRDYAPAPDRNHFYTRMVEQVLGPQPEVNYGGGASSFLKFMREELMPLVNSRYRTNPKDSTLFGDSLGGSFALYTLLSDPEAFSRYLIGSPAVSWGNDYLPKLEAATSKTRPRLPANVYLAVGGNEGPGVSEMLKMAEALKRYRDITLQSQIFDGETHISVVPFTIAWGLRKLYCTPPSALGCGTRTETGLIDMPGDPVRVAP